MLVLDVETVAFGPARMAPPLVVLAVGGQGGADIIHHSEAEPVVSALLASDETLVGVHIAYDMAVLAEAYPHLRPAIFAKYDRGEVLDLGIRQRLVDLAAGSLGWAVIDGKTTRARYSMAELARRHLGLDLAKGEDTWRTRYGELRDLPIAQWPEEARTYAELDITVPAQLLPLVPPMPDELRQTRTAFWVQLMHCWGMEISPEAVERFAAAARENYERLAATLVASGLKRPDRQKRDGSWVEGSRDTKAAMTRLVAAYAAKGEPHPTTDTGKPSLDEDACLKSGDPTLADYAAFSSASKTLSNDVPLFSKYGRPIHARFNVLLETGDIGCSAPNLVNLPTAPGVRECFVARDGYVLLACDYAAIQLRTWAQVCIYLLGFSTMADVLNRGDCAHTMIAADLLGIPYADAKRRPNKTGQPETIYFERQCGKVANFGFQGGMGPARLVSSAALQYGVVITEAQARKLKSIWRGRWREAQPYLDEVSRLTANGKTRHVQYGSGRIRGQLGYCDLANGIFSALSYDAIKDAGWLVSKACYADTGSPLLGSRIVNVIHDELLLEVPEALATECAEEVERLMIAGATPWIPDVPPKVESTLMRRWSKQASSKRLPDGRLSIWE